MGEFEDSQKKEEKYHIAGITIVTLAPSEQSSTTTFTILADASNLTSLTNIGEDSGIIIMWPAHTAANSTITSAAAAASASTPAAAVGGLVSGGGSTPYRPFESAFDDFSRPNPFPSPEPPVPPPSTLSLSPPPPTVVLGPNNNWSLSPPEDDKSSAASAAAAAVAAAAAAAASGGIGIEMEQVRGIHA